MHNKKQTVNAALTIFELVLYRGVLIKLDVDGRGTKRFALGDDAVCQSLDAHRYSVSSTIIIKEDRWLRLHIQKHTHPVLARPFVRVRVEGEPKLVFPRF